MNASPGRHQYDPFRDLFPARLTAVTGTPPRYDWTEQRIDADGNYADADAPRQGSASGVNAAREVNDREVEVPTYAWLRLRGGGPDGDLIYEFQAGGGGGGTLHGVLDDQLDFEDTATMSVYTGGTDTGTDVTVHDWLLLTGQSVPAGTRVIAALDATDGLYYAISASCGI